MCPPLLVGYPATCVPTLVSRLSCYLCAHPCYLCGCDWWTSCGISSPPPPPSSVHHQTPCGPMDNARVTKLTLFWIGINHHLRLQTILKALNIGYPTGSQIRLVGYPTGKSRILAGHPTWKGRILAGHPTWKGRLLDRIPERTDYLTGYLKEQITWPDTWKGKLLERIPERADYLNGYLKGQNI